MRNRFLLGMMTFCLVGTTSCKDEIDQFDGIHGNSFNCLLSRLR